MNPTEDREKGGNFLSANEDGYGCGYGRRRVLSLSSAYGSLIRPFPTCRRRHGPLGSWPSEDLFPQKIKKPTIWAAGRFPTAGDDARECPFARAD